MVLGSSGEDQPRLATDSKLRGSVRTRREYYVACSPEQQSVDSFRDKSDKRKRSIICILVMIYVRPYRSLCCVTS